MPPTACPEPAEGAQAVGNKGAPAGRKNKTIEMLRSALSEGRGRSGSRSEPGFARLDSRGGSPWGFRRERRQRHRHMLMHRLPLVVIFRMQLTIRPGDGL